MDISLLFFIAVFIASSTETDVVMGSQLQESYSEDHDYPDYGSDDDDDSDLENIESGYGNEGEEDEDDYYIDGSNEYSTDNDDHTSPEDDSEEAFENEGVCAISRRQIEELDEEEEGFMPACTVKGEYQLRQCHKQQCWCVSEDGEEREGSRQDVVKQDDFYCSAANTENLSQHADKFEQPTSNHPAFLVAVMMLAIVGLTGAVMVAMFVVYRMRKKDEGSYALANNNKILISSNNINNNGYEGKRSMLLNNNYLSKQELPAPHLHCNMQQELQQEFYA